MSSQASRRAVTVRKSPLRLEVDSWYPPDPRKFTPDQVEVYLIQNSLFLWALQILQEKHPCGELSYFQIAGIHGFPYQPWDEPNCAPEVGNQGYCTHDSLLFLPWHRPYMALFEQVLYNITVTDILKEVPEIAHDEWKQAADTWRLPYWDWAVKKLRVWTSPNPSLPGRFVSAEKIYDLPIIAQNPTIKVKNYANPKGRDVVINNPMYQFRMPDNNPMGSFGIKDIRVKVGGDDKDCQKPKVSEWVTLPFSQSRATSRWAATPPKGEAVGKPWEDGTVDNESVAPALKAHEWYDGDFEKIPLAEMVYRLYDPEYVKTFAQFATTKQPSHWSVQPRGRTEEAEEAPGPFAQLSPTAQPVGQTDGNASTLLNLEFIHNNIHVWVGGFGDYTGHMAKVPVAGFDPIFFMHHCNIDRLFAIWQALDQDNTTGETRTTSWFPAHYEERGNWHLPPGTVPTANTDLAPFHKNAEGEFWNSVGIEKWTSLGYSYPELQPWRPEFRAGGKLNDDKYKDSIKEQLKTLYQPKGPPAAVAWGNQDLGWDIIVNVTYDRFAFQGHPYTIYFFLGEKDKSEKDKKEEDKKEEDKKEEDKKEEDTAKKDTAEKDKKEEDTVDRTSPHRRRRHRQLVGYVYTFSNPVFSENEGCGDCLTKSKEGTRCRAQLPLNGALLARAKGHQERSAEASEAGSTGPSQGQEYLGDGIYVLPSLDKDAVLAYLEKYLHWSVELSGGTPVDIPEENPFFEVVVHHRPATLQNQDPDIHYKPQFAITHGKLGGAKQPSGS
ncbi:common central domain of tyrosinase-domain-containing protein [Dichotomopilus funicola]|uniref:tyrosinase n=1 Tax=Dichotomopilus funicola TaxID=1934379 RepID=A0AAN6ZPW2_9PEZI|nr:common central domain of tyrosinase-domain-containing protein [Dichotomopilus funicola]